MQGIHLAFALALALPALGCAEGGTRQAAESGEPQAIVMPRDLSRGRISSVADEASAEMTVRRYAPPRPPTTSHALEPGSPVTTVQTAVGARSLRRSAELELEASDPATAADRVRRIAAELGGYVGSSDAFRSQGRVAYTISLWVPGDLLDDAVGRIKGLAVEVDRERILAEDVTDRVIDVDARLSTLRSVEAELRTLLDNAGDGSQELQDVMAVYKELADIRTAIERQEAQQALLAHQVAFASIGVTLQPTPLAAPRRAWSPLQTAQRSARSLVAVLQALSGLVIFFVIVILPVALMVALPIWGTARLWQWSRAAR